jgi:O-antigen ligase
MATTEVNFGSGSEVNASGGYGPNQVSSMLGLGALLAMFLNLEEKCSTWLKGFFVVLTLWFLAQSVLTFSRTGFYLFVVAFGMASVFLAQRKSGGRRLVLLLLVIGAAICAVLPMLDALTGGKLTQRFNDRGLTGRDTIAKLDLEIFRDRPLFGAGIGMSMYYRAVDGDAPAAHTEYTRLLADHGMLGVGALIILLNMTGQAFLRARGPWAKAIVTALAIWALLFMSVTAMRLAVPAFLLGLVHARFLSDKRMRMLVAKTKRKSRLPAQADDYPRMPRASQCLSTIGKFGK